MYKPMMLSVALLAFCTVEVAVSGQESTKADFTDYGRAMEGEWLGKITLWGDIPGIGKKGDKMTVRWVLEVTQGGNAIVGNGSDGQGTAAALYYYDVDKKRIKGITVFSGGTVVFSVATKKDGNTWERRNAAVDPDGTKTESLDTLVISDGGSTHTWTRGGESNVWRRVAR